jgi:dynamin 1-like protein
LFLYIRILLYLHILILQVENLVAIELAYINTKHPDFHKDAALVSSLLKSVEEDERLPRPANKKYVSAVNVNQPSASHVGDTEKDVPKVGHIKFILR